MGGIKKLFYLIVLCVLAYAVTFQSSDEQYEKEGILVTATITHKEGFRGRQSYECTYNNAQGESVTAHLILNKFNKEVGDQVEGYYLQDTPDKVYCPPGKLLKYSFIIVVDSITIIYILALMAGLFVRE